MPEEYTWIFISLSRNLFVVNRQVIEYDPHPLKMFKNTCTRESTTTSFKIPNY